MTAQTKWVGLMHVTAHQMRVRFDEVETKLTILAVVMQLRRLKIATGWPTDFANVVTRLASYP